MGENIGDWKKRLASFDFEVTAYDWLLCIKEKETGEWHDFHNDPQGVIDYLNGNDLIFAGYNNKHYDNYILKGVLNHYTPDEIKWINDMIIVIGMNGWEINYDNPYVQLPYTTDLMMDMLGVSLKECEGNLLMNIQESTIDFNIDHPWNEEEFEKMRHYCHHDVESTERLLDERMSYLDSKVALGEMCGLSVEKSLYMTNAQLAAKSLGAVKQEHNDYHDYVIPPEVDLELIPTTILDFIKRFQTVDENELHENNEKLMWKGDIVGTEHKIGLGGIHAAKKNYFEESDDKRIIVDFDVNSYYPSLMIEYKYLSRNVKDPSLYEAYYHQRIDAKMRGDKKTANGLKLVLNTTYGASLQKFNDLYDPLMGVSTCLTGQLLLTQLLITLQAELPSFVHIQSNTDGVMFSVNRDELNHAREIVKQWSDRTRLGMGEIQIKRVIQKDVNNYIIENFDGEITVKGGYVSDYEPSFKHNSFSITATALVRYFVDNIPVEETINQCSDPFRFQMIGKTGSSYNLGCVHYVDGEEVHVQKVNRIYASKDKRYGQLKKVKKQYLELDEDGERRYYINQKGKRTYKKAWEVDEDGEFFITKATVQNCPEHAIIDNSCQITIDNIDKEWYINLAKKRIDDFLGIETKGKGGRKKMAAKKKETNDKGAATVLKVNPENNTFEVDQTLATIQLYQKIFNVGVILANMKWEMNGYNEHQSYEYISSDVYRARLGEACRQVGLLYKMNIANRQYEKLEGKMNLTTCYGTISFIDIESGSHEDYMIMGDGADNLDKGIYKAETMMIKYFVLNNFLLPKQQDEVDPESSKTDKQAEQAVKEVAPEKVAETKPHKPVSTEGRKAAAKTVVEDDNASPERLNALIGAIERIRELKGQPEYGVKTYDRIQKALKGELTISKVDAMKLTNTFEERLDELEATKTTLDIATDDLPF